MFIKYNVQQGQGDKVLETNEIHFIGGLVHFVAEHDNDMRGIPMEFILSITKVCP